MRTPEPTTERMWAVAIGNMWVEYYNGEYRLKTEPYLYKSDKVASDVCDSTGGKMFHWERVTTFSPSIGAVAEMEKGAAK